MFADSNPGEEHGLPSIVCVSVLPRPPTKGDFVYMICMKPMLFLCMRVCVLRRLKGDYLTRMLRRHTSTTISLKHFSLAEGFVPFGP